jgi:hypothetical protein
MCYCIINIPNRAKHAVDKEYIFIWGVGRDSAVGIATRYRLECPRIESRWGRDFSHPSRPALGPTQPPIH